MIIMNCSRCKSDAIITQNYSGVSLCETHLILDIEAKAKKEMRKSGGITFGEKIFFSQNFDAVSFSLDVFLKKLLAKRDDVSFTTSVTEATCCISSDSLHDVAESVLKKVLLGKADELLIDSSKKKILAPFSVIPFDEIILYAKFHGWNSGEMQGSENFSDEVAMFLKNFQTCHPSTLYALKNVRDQILEMYQEKQNAV